MRTALLILATTLSTSAFAAAPAPAPAKSEPARPAPAPAAAADDEDDDAPPKPAETKTDAATAAPAPLGAVPPSGVDNQKLVAGAPLYNPNVAVHIVEKKEYSDKWVREVSLFGTAQVNGKFTNHVGTALAFTWHLQENFALMAMGQWNFIARESDWSAELADKVRAQAEAATSLLLIGGVFGGVEVTPLYGKFVFYDSYLIHFAVVLTAGAGAGMTRIVLKPANESGPATFGETGWRFLAEIGGGFRVQFMRWLTLRLELRDLVYAAQVNAINGCNSNDLKAMDAILRAGQPITSANVGAACDVPRFDGVDDMGDDDPSNDRRRNLDVPLAASLVKTPSSDVLNNLGVYLGLSFTF